MTNDYRTHRLAVKNSDESGMHELVFYDFGPTDDPTPIICVHGLTRNAHDFDRLATALAARGRRVLTLSMAGRGESARLENPLLYTYATYVTDCIAILDNFHFRQVDWVGTSMGGIIGMILASVQPARIRSLLMNDIGATLKREALVRIFSNVRAIPTQFDSEAEAQAYLEKAYVGFGLTADEWPEFSAISLTQNAQGKLQLTCDPNIAKPLAQDTKDFTEINDISLAEFWKKVSCPTLILHGEKSDILDAETIRAMRAVHLETESVTIPGVGHAPALMSESQIAIVINWLNRRNPSIPHAGL